MKILTFEADELKVWVFIILTVFGLLQLLQGKFILAFVFGGLGVYFLYREEKSNDWMAFKNFVSNFKKKEKEISDEELLTSLSEEMKEK